MLLLGLLHAALLFYGDILGAYAIAGLLLVWIFFGRRERTLWTWVWVICGLLTVYALFSIVVAVALMLFAPDELVASMAASGGFDMSSARDLAYDQSYWISALFRVGFWLVAALPIALTATPLPILLGWIAARRQILDEPGNHIRLLRRVAVGGIAIGWLGGLPQALMHLGILPMSEAVPWAFAGLTSFTGVVCGLGYAAAFGLLAVRLESRQIPASDPGPRADRETRRAAREEKAAAETALSPAELSYGVATSAEVPPVGASPGLLPRVLSAVGQRSLTFYLFQSLLLAPLMASWAFRLGEHLSTTQAVAIALGVWAISLPIAALMDSRGVRGPAEMLLRRMTYGKHAPSA